MSKHTPGPWTIGPTDKTRFGVFTQPEAAIQVVCYTASNQHDRTEEAAANARLIAAAPDLLEALRAVVDLSGVGHEDPDCPEDDTCRCSTITLVNSALRKAEGRESER